MALIPGNDFNGWRGQPPVNFHILQFRREGRGEVTIKRQFSGDIYLICSKNPNRIIYSSVFLFGGVAPVAVTALKSLNSSKGVVWNRELARTDLDEIKRMFR